MIYSDGHFYLKPLPSSEKDIKLGDKTYSTMALLNSKKEEVASLDYFYLLNVRIDYEDDLFRIYPDVGDDLIVYDDETCELESMKESEYDETY